MGAGFLPSMLDSRNFVIVEKAEQWMGGGLHPPIHRYKHFTCGRSRRSFQRDVIVKRIHILRLHSEIKCSDGGI